ncbi:MAG: RraA family protein [Pleomorphochaeta sp.]
MNIGFSINNNIERCSQEDINFFKGIPVANIGDCMNRNSCLSAELIPANKKKLCGNAYTIKSVAGDNLLLYYAIDNAQENDVLVYSADGYDNRAICGELMCTWAMKRKLGGIIINGAVRDIDALSELDFPVYYKSVSPNGPYKNGPGEVNSPLAIRNQVINPGDLIVGDSDGIICIQQKYILELKEKVQQVLKKEEKIFDGIIKNNTFETDWVYEILNKNQITY